MYRYNDGDCLLVRNLDEPQREPSDEERQWILQVQRERSVATHRAKNGSRHRTEESGVKIIEKQFNV